MMGHCGVPKVRRQQSHGKTREAVESLERKIRALALNHGLGAVFFTIGPGYVLRDKLVCMPDDFGPPPETFCEVSTVN